MRRRPRRRRGRTAGSRWRARCANTSSAAPPRCPDSMRLRERLLVDDAAARSVHDARALLGQFELALSDQPFGVGRARKMDRDEVGLHEQRLERRHHVHAEFARPLLGHVRIEGDDAHPERGQRAPPPSRPRARARRCRRSCRAVRRPDTGSGPSGRHCRAASACGMFRACASSSAIECSAADTMFDWARSPP